MGSEDTNSHKERQSKLGWNCLYWKLEVARQDEVQHDFSTIWQSVDAVQICLLQSETSSSWIGVPWIRFLLAAYYQRHKYPQPNGQEKLQLVQLTWSGNVIPQLKEANNRQNAGPESLNRCRQSETLIGSCPIGLWLIWQWKRRSTAEWRVRNVPTPVFSH